MNTLKYTIQSISTRPHQQREHIGEAGFRVRAVVREIWELLLLHGETLLHRDSVGL